MTDALLARLAFDPGHQELTPIPFPAGQAPKPIKLTSSGDAPLPRADVVVLSYTYAEGQALADVLSAGHQMADWIRYTKDFASYEGALTYRSPAKEAKNLGSYALSQVGDSTVLLFKSSLHLATDSKALPYRRLLAQIITESRPVMIIDSGTAGGIGADVVEGDTVVAQNLRFDCTGFLKDEPYAHENFPCTYDTSHIDFSLAEQLMQANAAALRPEATRDPKVWSGDVLTCDAFLFDDAEHTYRLNAYDPAAMAEEMDAATLGLVAQDLGSSMPRFTSLRSVSDPMIPQMPTIKAEEASASKIYERYGYAAQVATLGAVWQVIAQL